MFTLNKMQMSPPWVTYYRKLLALFEQDKEIRVLFDQEAMEIRLYVDNHPKAEALQELLPGEVDFGNVTLHITIIPSNKEDIRYGANDWQVAFDGNPALAKTVGTVSPFGTFLYVVWQNRIVQFFNDNMADYAGNTSVLYEDIAREIFKEETGVFHCTEYVAEDGTEKFHSPLGEWP